MAGIDPGAALPDTGIPIPVSLYRWFAMKGHKKCRFRLTIGKRGTSLLEMSFCGWGEQMWGRKLFTKYVGLHSEVPLVIDRPWRVSSTLLLSGPRR